MKKKIQSKKKKNNLNWTESDLSNFRYYVGADFIDQLQSSFNSLGITQRTFAKNLSLTESRISQVFNNPGNLTLDTMIKWSRAAGLKTGVVLYNDHDQKNLRGPISGSIFVECWKQAGAPIMFPETTYQNAVHKTNSFDERIKRLEKTAEMIEKFLGEKIEAASSYFSNVTRGGSCMTKPNEKNEVNSLEKLRDQEAEAHYKKSGHVPTEWAVMNFHAGWDSRDKLAKEALDADAKASEK